MEGVFIFGNEAQGWYKIGTSQNIEHRFAEISNLAPFPLKISARWPCQRKYCRELQLHLHDLFASKWIQGEWFALTPQDVATASNAVIAWKASMGGEEDSRKLVKQVNFLVEPAMYEQLRQAAFNARISISSLIRRRLTSMTEDEFRTQALDPVTGKITMTQIIVILRGIGLLQ
jgi:hypothetical protein